MTEKFTLRHIVRLSGCVYELTVIRGGRSSVGDTTVLRLSFQRFDIIYALVSISVIFGALLTKPKLTPFRLAIEEYCFNFCIVNIYEK